MSMNFFILYGYYSYVCSSLGYLFLGLSLIFGLAYFIWKFAAHVYEVATTESGIHYIEFKPQQIKMGKNVLNPLSIHIDFGTASFSSVRCDLTINAKCYIQALWGVPVFALIEFMNKDHPEIVNLIATFTSSEEFALKSVHASNPLLLDKGDQNIEFQLPSHVDKALLSDSKEHSRTIYPLAILMVVAETVDRLFCDSPYVVASANTVHLSDNVLHKSQRISQLIKLLGGSIGEIKKIYPASPFQEGKTELCITCCQEPVSMVQLSCRHLCLCKNCYTKCDKCPVCRNTHMYFFELPLFDENHHGQTTSQEGEEA